MKYKMKTKLKYNVNDIMDFGKYKKRGFTIGDLNGWDFEYLTYLLDNSIIVPLEDGYKYYMVFKSIFKKNIK